MWGVLCTPVHRPCSSCGRGNLIVFPIKLLLTFALDHGTGPAPTRCRSEHPWGSEKVRHWQTESSGGWVISPEYNPLSLFFREI